MAKVLQYHCIEVYVIGFRNYLLLYYSFKYWQLVSA